MRNSFAGYGEQEQVVTCYCEEISLEEIEQRSNILWENFRMSDKVYISNDLYADLLKQCAHSHNLPAPHTIMKIRVPCGELDVIRVSGMSNFCLVGTESDYNLVERAKIDKAFEEIVFNGRDVHWGSTPKDNEIRASEAIPVVDNEDDRRG